VVKLLIESGAELESKGHGGMTTLFGAVHCGCKAVVELLIESGTELESKDGEGRRRMAMDGWCYLGSSMRFARLW